MWCGSPRHSWSWCLCANSKLLVSVQVSGQGGMKMRCDRLFRFRIFSDWLFSGWWVVTFNLIPASPAPKTQQKNDWWILLFAYIGRQLAPNYLIEVVANILQVLRKAGTQYVRPELLYVSLYLYFIPPLLGVTWIRVKYISATQFQDVHENSRD